MPVRKPPQNDDQLPSLLDDFSNEHCVLRQCIPLNVGRGRRLKSKQLGDTNPKLRQLGLWHPVRLTKVI